MGTREIIIKELEDEVLSLHYDNCTLDERINDLEECLCTIYAAHGEDQLISKIFLEVMK